MALELDAYQLQCPLHARLAVAFGTRQPSDGTEGPWHPWCPADLKLYADRDAYFYVRFRPDPSDHNDPAAGLKHSPGSADDNG